MLVNEVITSKHSFDVLRNPAIVKLDAMFDLLEESTSNFYVPAEFLPGYDRLEFTSLLQELNSVLLEVPLRGIWRRKLKILNKYFNIA